MVGERSFCARSFLRGWRSLPPGDEVQASTGSVDAPTSGSKQSAGLTPTGVKRFRRSLSRRRSSTDGSGKSSMSLLGEFANVKKSGVSRRSSFSSNNGGLDLPRVVSAPRAADKPEMFFGEALEEQFPDEPSAVLIERQKNAMRLYESRSEINFLFSSSSSKLI